MDLFVIACASIKKRKKPMTTDSNPNTETVSRTFSQRGGDNPQTVKTTYKIGPLQRGSQTLEQSKETVVQPIMRTCHL